MQLTLEEKADQFNALSLECNLMIFHRADCDCSNYWARNGKRLIPTILDQALAKMVDPLEYFTKYAREVHDRHKDDWVLTT